eukprot:753630_1
MIGAMQMKERIIIVYGMPHSFHYDKETFLWFKAKITLYCEDETFRTEYIEVVNHFFSKYDTIAEEMLKSMRMDLGGALFEYLLPASDIEIMKIRNVMIADDEYFEMKCVDDICDSYPKTMEIHNECTDSATYYRNAHMLGALIIVLCVVIAFLLFIQCREQLCTAVALFGHGIENVWNTNGYERIKNEFEDGL